MGDGKQFDLNQLILYLKTIQYTISITYRRILGSILLYLALVFS